MDFKKFVNMEKLKREIACIGLFIVCIAAALSTPLVHGDSHIYISGQIHVPILYKTFFYFMNLVFSQYAVNAMVIIQSILLFICGRFFFKTLFQHFSIPGFAMFIASLPLYYYGYMFSHSILTESIAFPLFLFSISLFLNLLVSKKIRDLLVLSIVIYLMFITRGQLVFSLALLLVCCLFFFRQKYFLLFFISLVLIPMIFGLSNLTQRTSTYLTTGEFEAPSYGGIQLATSAFYASSMEDISTLPLKYQDLGKSIMLELEENSLTASTYQVLGPYHPYPQNIAHHYRMMFDHITWVRINKKVRNFVPSSENILERMLEINEVSKKMAVHLILQSPKDFFTVVKNNITFYSFGRTGTLLMFVSIYLAIFILAIITGKAYLFFLLGVFSVYIANVVIVSVFVFGYDRYLFYTDVVLAYVVVSFLYSMVLPEIRERA